MATGKPPYAHRWNDPAVTVDMMRSVKPSRGARRRARSCSLRNRERTFGDPESMLGSYIGTLVQRDCSEGGACYHGWLLYLRKNVMRVTAMEQHVLSNCNATVIIHSKVLGISFSLSFRGIGIKSVSHQSLWWYIVHFSTRTRLHEPVEVHRQVISFACHAASPV